MNPSKVDRMLVGIFFLTFLKNPLHKDTDYSGIHKPQLLHKP